MRRVTVGGAASATSSTPDSLRQQERSCCLATRPLSPKLQQRRCPGCRATPQQLVQPQRTAKVIHFSQQPAAAAGAAAESERGGETARHRLAASNRGRWRALDGRCAKAPICPCHLLLTRAPSMPPASGAVWLPGKGPLSLPCAPRADDLTDPVWAGDPLASGVENQQVLTRATTRSARRRPSSRRRPAHERMERRRTRCEAARARVGLAAACSCRARPRATCQSRLRAPVDGPPACADARDGNGACRMHGMCRSVSHVSVRSCASRPRL